MQQRVTDPHVDIVERDVVVHGLHPVLREDRGHPAGRLRQVDRIVHARLETAVFDHRRHAEVFEMQAVFVAADQPVGAGLAQQRESPDRQLFARRGPHRHARRGVGGDPLQGDAVAELDIDERRRRGDVTAIGRTQIGPLPGGLDGDEVADHRALHE